MTECVVLLHGLLRTRRSMRKMQKTLERRGYAVYNLGYPSRRYPIETLTECFLQPALERHCIGRYQKLHFVTHSMGGILLRRYLSRYRVPELGRVVMLSPPNRGSELVDKLKGNVFFRLLNGPAGRQLGTENDSSPNRLGPVNFELGVITGNFSLDWLFGRMIPGESDGKVAVARAGVDGMRDFKVVPYGHAFIMRKPGVIVQVVQFLRTGRFLP